MRKNNKEFPDPLPPIQPSTIHDPYCLNNAARNNARPNINIKTASTEDRDR